jgi:hydroxymethylpyrimidine pyrophosphatase-like HAD family hydrolase
MIAAMLQTKLLKRLVSLDIDGTVLSGDAAREARFRHWAATRSPDIALAYASGRSIQNIRAEISSGRLPRANFLIGHLGTLIEGADGPADELMERLFSLVRPSWDAKKALAAGRGPGVEPQEEEHNNAYKASFYWDGKPESLSSFYGRMKAALPAVSWRSMEVDAYYIDVMPHCIGKAGATLVVAASLGIDPENIVISGDSENDQDLFMEKGFKKIIPSNAAELLKRIAPEAFRSPYPDADGVLDGLRAFGFVTPSPGRQSPDY